MAIKQILNALNLKPGTVIRVERLVLLELANMADSRNGNTCYPGIEHLEGKTGYGGTAIKDAIKLLISKKFITSKRRFGTSNYYVVHVPDYSKKKSGLDVFSFLHQGKKGLHLHCLCLQALWTLCVYSMDGMNLTVGRYESIGKR